MNRTIRLTSEAFENEEIIPASFTSKGQGLSPPLAWSQVPERTKSLVIIMTDDELPSARLQAFKITHWILYNIPPHIPGLPGSVSDDALSTMGIKAGRNWSKATGYYPPAPLYGRHRYVFRIYALDTEKLEPQKSSRRGILKAMKSHVLAFGELSGFVDK